jgi:hypothetical protein
MCANSTKKKEKKNVCASLGALYNFPGAAAAAAALLHLSFVYVVVEL